MGVLDVKPNTPKANLEDFIFTVYGTPKSGKTTLFYNLVKTKYGDLSKGLLLGFEKGYQSLKGIYAADINSWDDFQEAVDDLVDNVDEVPYRLLGLDTIDAMADMVNEYVVAQERVRRKEPTLKIVGDIPYGGGYDLVAKEVTKQLFRLQKAGYGLFFITHNKDKKIESRSGISYDKTTVSLSGRIKDIIINMSDFIVFIDNKVSKSGKDVQTERVIHFRAEGSDLEAGSRFKNIVPSIPYDVDLFLEAFEDAVLSEHDEGVDIEKVRKQQAEEKAQQVQEYVKGEKETSNEPVEMSAKDYHGEINKLLGAMTDEQLVDAKTRIKQVIKISNYTKVTDTNKLKEIVESLKEIQV